MCILSRPEKSKGKVKSQSARRQKVDASSKRLIYILSENITNVSFGLFVPRLNSDDFTGFKLRMAYSESSNIQNLWMTLQRQVMGRKMMVIENLLTS